MSLMLDIVHAHKTNRNRGIYSVCSAHPLVLEAALKQGVADDSPILIEATSNQVNQFGGYTGMTPANFRAFALQIADAVCFDPSRIILGGDHLGPNVWKKKTADEAMILACSMVREYVLAGFRKIHLDCSMSCNDDPMALSDEIVAERAAQLCQVAEEAWREVGGEAPVYVIGTEVPVPGGAHEELGPLQITSPEAALQTLGVHRTTFAKAGLADALKRTIALVVQPGVEFDNHKVIRYEPEKAQALSTCIAHEPLVFEAHSTDYQNEAALGALVHDHFAILKVGPSLTFALREALFALEAIEREIYGALGTSNLKEVIWQVMQEEPEYWLPYYAPPGHQQYLDRTYSLSDRIRYYWPHPKVTAAEATLFANLDKTTLIPALVSQHLPHQAAKAADGLLALRARDLAIDKIMEITGLYARSCGLSQSPKAHRSAS